ncbi:MAG TPA: hypothetical protein DCO74_11830 [Pseudomonas sp.]|nr:hypothetical protein [Pseudomonas sp.]
MAMSKAEQAALEALKNGATFAEAMDMLPEPTSEQLAQLDENGDYILPPNSSELTTEQRPALRQSS